MHPTPSFPRDFLQQALQAFHFLRDVADLDAIGRLEVIVEKPPPPAFDFRPQVVVLIEHLEPTCQGQEFTAKVADELPRRVGHVHSRAE